LVEWELAGEPKYSKKTCPRATFSTTNPTWPDLGSNPGRGGGKPATNSPSYGTASLSTYGGYEKVCAQCIPRRLSKWVNCNYTTKHLGTGIWSEGNVKDLQLELKPKVNFPLWSKPRTGSQRTNLSTFPYIKSPRRIEPNCLLHSPFLPLNSFSFPLPFPRLLS
jgi:hypothetical protein